MKNIIKKLKKFRKTTKTYILFYIKKIKKFFINTYKKISKFFVKRFRSIVRFFPTIYKEATALLLLVSLLASSFWGSPAIAATYIFNQESWSGASVNTATHTSNRNGWSEYSSLTGAETANGGADIVLPTTLTSITQTDETNSNTGFNLTGNAFLQTATTGSGSVVLTTSVGAVSVSSVSMGYAHTCAVAETGKVYCWGLSAQYQLGNNSINPTQQGFPSVVLKGAAVAGDNDGTYLTNIKSVVVPAHTHTCALSNGGNVYCWGYNDGGQVGDNSISTTSQLPARVLKGAAVAGDNDGTYLTNIKSMSTANTHTCAVSNNDNVYCWGQDINGQLGINMSDPYGDDGEGGPAGYQSLIPVRVLKGAAVAGDNDGTYLTNIKSVFTGGDSSCAISNDDNVYCWGVNFYSKLGDGTTTKRTVPIRVLKGAAVAGDNDGTYLTNIKNISIGSGYSCAVSNNNNAYCWGNNSYGQLGDNTITPRSTPVQVVKGISVAGDNDGTYLTNIKDISSSYQISGQEHTCAVSNNDNAYCWGHNINYKLGDSTATQRNAPVRVLKGAAVAGDNDGTYLTNIKNISSGEISSCAVSNNNNAYCWGGNNFNQLGDNTTIARSTAIQVHGVGNVGYLFLAAVSTYNTSGTYISGPINLGFGTPAWGNLSWTSSGTGTITLKARSSATGAFVDGDDAIAWASCSNITSGQALSTGNCVTNGHQYIQYQAILSTSDTSVTPSLDDVTIGYSGYTSSGTLVSSIYDSEDVGNVMGGVSWVEDATLPAGTGVTLSLRTASSTGGIVAASWTNFSNGTFGCEKNDVTVSCDGSTIPQSMKSGGDDRYFQYQITLTSTGANTPMVGSVNITYVVNARPEFDVNYPDPEVPGTGSIASQVVNQESENLGKVFIQYSVRDTDTSLGSVTPGAVTPSFEYNIGSGWVAVNPTYLRQADVENKLVDALNYTEYSALWDVVSQIPGQYSATARIRVTINDNEGANNTATSETPAFVLDTSGPAISSFVINSATDTISLTGSDDTNLQYRLANTADYSDAGAWVDVGANTLDASINDWNILGAPGEETVYVQIKDIYGNLAAGTAVAPVTIQNLDLRDVGNILTGEFREFLTWGLYQEGDSTAFSSYEVYRSTNGTDYSLLSSISDINQNYYTDSGLSNLNTYYYKIKVIDADGDYSNYSAIVSDTPDGQGGTDFTAPSISDVDVAELQTTWVRINWTTDEISDSVVEYSISPSTTFNLIETNTALVTNHSIVVDDLTPNTEYLFRVKSTDFLSNTGTDDNSAAGYSFSTAGGPAISDVAVRSVDDNTATIVWNTDRSANSYVVFAGEISDLEAGTNINTVGSAGFVQSPFEHQVILTDLISKSTYYFYVKSTDEESGYESIDNRSGSFYTFNTTNDQKAPTISNIATPIISPNAASITWVTDELADSLVEYGTEVDTYDNSSSLDSTMSIYHVITLNGLTTETPYYIKVKSNDSAGNSAEATSSFITIPELNTVYVSSGGGGSSSQVDTAPAKISNLEVKNETSFSAVVSFDTDEETTGFVNFGEDTQYGKTIGSSSFLTSHEVKMFGLRSGTTYNFEIKVFDKGGNMSASTNRTFTTKFASEMVDELVMLDNVEEFQSKIEGIIESTLPSLIPPVISDIEVTNVSDTSADVSWKTNVKSFGVIALVKGDRFDITSENPYEFEMSNIEEKVKEHKLALQSLEPGTKYHFQVRSFSIPGVVGKSKDYNFATRAPNAKAGAVKTTNNSFTVSWQTADATTSFVEYKNLKSGKVTEMGNKELTKNHILEVNNLPGATTFEVTYFGHTADGVKIEGSPIRVTTQIDNRAPAISDVSISSAFIPYRPNQLQTLISWKTDEPANSIVEYEEGPGSAEKLANKLGEEAEYTKEHIVILPGFKPGTIYRVRITSSDMAGNDGLVPTRTIITPVATDSVFEIIINNFEDVFGFLKNVR